MIFQAKMKVVSISLAISQTTVGAVSPGRHCKSHQDVTNKFSVWTSTDKRFHPGVAENEVEAKKDDDEKQKSTKRQD